MFTLIISKYSDNIHESTDLRICEFKSIDKRDDLLSKALDPDFDMIFNFDTIEKAEDAFFTYQLNRSKEYTKIINKLIKTNILPFDVPKNCRWLFVHLDNVITPFPDIYRVSLNTLLLLMIKYKENIKIPKSKIVNELKNLNDVVVFHDDVLNNIPNLLVNDIENIFNLL
jgi:hypothetical protein